MTSIPIGGASNFWARVGARLGAPLTDGSLHYVALDSRVRMRIIVRRAEELFSTTAARLGGAHKAIVNGNYYDVTFAGKVDAFSGNDPVPAAETLVEGQLVSGGTVVAGSSEPSMFYFAQIAVPGGLTYGSGFGNPPATAVSAIGGAGPLIIQGQKYGSGNRYSGSVPAGAPPSGPPGARFGSHLTQRSNATYLSVSSRPPSTGKTVLAYSSAAGRILVIAQPHGTAGITHDALRDKLALAGVDHAVFLDGSDSTMLMVGSNLLVRSGQNKDELNVVGVGFQ